MMGNMNNSMNGSMNRMGGTSKDALLMAVNQAGFAVTEANLLSGYTSLRLSGDCLSETDVPGICRCKKCLRSPVWSLRAEMTRDTVYWSWTDDPWPWEGGGY